MRKFFLLTAIIEILAGLALFFAAEKIPDLINANPLTIGFAKMYGVAAFSLGLFALFSWKYFDLKIKPQQGKTVIWPSEWTHAHRGSVLNSGSKYIITGWMHFTD